MKETIIKKYADTHIIEILNTHPRGTSKIGIFGVGLNK